MDCLPSLALAGNGSLAISGRTIHVINTTQANSKYGNLWRSLPERRQALSYANPKCGGTFIIIMNVPLRLVKNSSSEIACVRLSVERAPLCVLCSPHTWIFKDDTKEMEREARLPDYDILPCII